MSGYADRQYPPFWGIDAGTLEEADPEYLGTSTVQGKPTPPPPLACTYTLEVREHHHSLTTYHLGLETLAELVKTVGRQFAVEMAGLPAAERHELEIRITPEPLRMPQEAM